MSNQQASQVNLFLFDLKNEATEHGFKAGESWNLEIATEDEIIKLKRHHHPVVSMRLQAQALLGAYLKVKSTLQQSLSKDDMALTAEELTRDEKKHLAAYPVRSFRS
jgi:hypothetical protein